MTQDIINILTKYEDRMRTAINSNYIRSITLSDLTKLKAAYKELTGIEYPMNGSCSVCQLRFMQKLGSVWLKKKDEINSVRLSPTLITNELDDTATANDKNTVLSDNNNTKDNKRNGKKTKTK